MKPRKNTTLIMVLGLVLFAFTTGIAQTPAQGDQKKKAEACCAMESCCCKGDSCEMMKEDGATMKHDMKDHKGDCCKAKSKNKKA